MFKFNRYYFKQFPLKYLNLSSNPSFNLYFTQNYFFLKDSKTPTLNFFTITFSFRILRSISRSSFPRLNTHSKIIKKKTLGMKRYPVRDNPPNPFSLIIHRVLERLGVSRTASIRVSWRGCRRMRPNGVTLPVLRPSVIP